jgi:Predicted redox protein, regulator of disulfide bond formation
MPAIETYTATVAWERNGAVFTARRYSRAHRWEFDGGVEVPASASPHSVPLPLSIAEAVDPEEAFVASVASCHMLWFLAIAAQQGHVVDSYRDAASATMGPDADGRVAILDVYLRPEVRFAGGREVAAEQLAELHHAAHAECFIANSVRSAIHCDPVPVP